MFYIKTNINIFINYSKVYIYNKYKYIVQINIIFRYNVNKINTLTY
jgi:hypothetical protein